MGARSKKKKKRQGKRAYQVQERVLLLFMVFFVSTVIVKLSQLHNIYENLGGEVEIVERQIDLEKERQVLLLNKKDHYESDAYTEQIARERLGLIMPDEIIFIVEP